MKRVVVTGMGIVSSLGNNKSEVLESLKKAKSGIEFSEIYANMGLRSHVHGSISEIDTKDVIDRKMLRFMADAAIYNAIALDEAIKQSEIDSSEAGVILGVGIGGMHTLEEQHSKVEDRGQRGVSPQFIPKMIANIAGSQIAIKYGFHGPNYAVTTACSSATDAIGMAYQLLQSGQTDIVISGGCEAGITPLTLSGFANMKALSTQNDNPTEASKPFDKNRDGFILSEGAGILVLESLEHAEKRNATILGEIVGYGCTNDAYHVTRPDNDSKSATKAINLALENSNLNPGDIDYINAHGTSTYYNDMLETQAIKQAFGNHAEKLLISSTKSMTGHLLGATGAIEAIACINALNEGIIPPTINYNTPDPECDLNYVPNKHVKKEINTAMSNSFGFGGHNSVLVFKKF